MAKLNPKAAEFKLSAASAEFVPGGASTDAKKPAKKGAAPAKGGSFFDEPKKVLATAPPPNAGGVASGAKKAPKAAAKAAGGGFFDQADAGKKKLGTAPPPSAGGVAQRAPKAEPKAEATPTPTLAATPPPVEVTPPPATAVPAPVVPSPSPSPPPPQSSPSATAAAAALEVLSGPPGGAPVAAGDKKADDEEPTDEHDDDPEIQEAKAEEDRERKAAKTSERAEAAAEGASAARAKAKAALSELKVHDEREHLNIVFIGHVDAGKSTISGQMLLLTNQVDERTMRKYEAEAKEKNRESWYIAYIMDTNEEERAKGKTVEVGRAHFTTTNKRYTLLDCPGHKSFVPNMIGGTAQADVGVLVISARKDEFETGFDRGGQTREHAMLAKTLGIRRLIVMVNKMDDPTVQWSKDRYDEIEGKLSPFLKQWGYNMAKEVTYIPVSGQYGVNLLTPVDPKVCPWYAGKPSFMQILDGLEPLERDPTAPLRIPVITRYKDMGVLYVLGKIESGSVIAGSELLLMPNNKRVQCTGVLVDEIDVPIAKTGENVVLKIKGVEEEEVLDGFVISSIESPVKRSKEFECQLAVLPLLDHKPIITAGYECVLHIHSLAMECKITRLVSEHDKKTGKPSKKQPTFIKNGSIAIVRLTTDETIAVENFKDYAQLGRFTLRDEGKTIGIGKIMRIKEFTK